MTLVAKCALWLNGTIGRSIETPGFRNVTWIFWWKAAQLKLDHNGCKKCWKLPYKSCIPTSNGPRGIATAANRVSSEQGFCQLVHWDNIKASPPENLKISLIAAFPTRVDHFAWSWICLIGFRSMENKCHRWMKWLKKQSCQLTLWQNLGMSCHASYTQSEWHMSARDLSCSVNWTSRMDTGEWWSHQRTNGILHPHC
jgi:hypothetical protein